MTPGGKPASSARCASASTLRGVSGDGLIIMVQPAAKAAPHLRKIMLITPSVKKYVKILVT
jgi:hypothetical protein